MAKQIAKTAPADEAAPQTKKFRRLFAAPNLEAAAAVRQGRITSHAFVALGREEAIAYLNTHCPTLGGVPLEIATRSADGEVTVLNAIAARKKR